MLGTCAKCRKVKPIYKGSMLCKTCYNKAKYTTHIKIKPPIKYTR